MNLDDEIKGLFLLVLAITGNFIGETLGCKTQKLLSENMILKQVFIVFMIFFALSFTSSDVVNPSTHVKKAFIVWIFYILFTKMNLTFTIATFLTLLALYIVGLYIDYYKKIDNKDSNQHKELLAKFETYKNALTKVILLLVVIGFVLYFIQQHQDHKTDFSLYKYLFGVRKCASLS